MFKRRDWELVTNITRDTQHDFGRNTETIEYVKLWEGQAKDHHDVKRQIKQLSFNIDFREGSYMTLSDGRMFINFPKFYILRPKS